MDPAPSPARRPLMRPDGTAVIKQVGLRRQLSRDLYHWLRAGSWWRILGLVSGIYAVGNVLFALLYRLGGNCIANARPGSFVDAFYFSIQTMATIGYGGMTPVGPWANALVFVESLVGLLLTAMTTGVVFAKFGAPNPRVLFSRHALVADHRDGRKLTFRLGNERDGHIIVEARIRVTLAFDEPEPHGGIRRRLCDLRLERTMSPLFQLSWSVFHPIDDASPLYALGPDDLQARNVTLIVTFTGVDDSLSQSVHARRAYGATDILFDRRFADILVDDGQGGRYVDYRRFHDHVPASARAAASGAA